MTIVVGITGGIGSGKSTFSKEVTKRGYRLLDSDAQVANIYNNPTNDFLNYLKKINLGSSINKRKINKKNISKHIFFNTNTKKKLENYIFRIVRQKRSQFIKNEKKNKTKIVFLDIPLLFENNLHKNLDLVISIISSRKLRFNRLKKSKKISKELFEGILKSQTSDVVREKYSDIIIYNNSSMRMYLTKINKTLDKIVK